MAFPCNSGSITLHLINKYNYKQPKVTKKLKDSLYVDDLIAGASDVQSARTYLCASMNYWS